MVVSFPDGIKREAVLHDDGRNQTIEYPDLPGHDFMASQDSHHRPETSSRIEE